MLNSGTPSIAGFKLSKTGMLTYIAGSKQSLSLTSPEQIGFNPEGNLLVVTDKGTSTIDTFTVDWNGVADAANNQASAGTGPYGFAFTDKGTLVVSQISPAAVSSYDISYKGLLTTLSGNILVNPTGTPTPCWVAINDKNTYCLHGQRRRWNYIGFLDLALGRVNLGKQCSCNSYWWTIA